MARKSFKTRKDTTVVEENSVVIEVVDRDKKVHTFKGGKSLRFWTEGTLARLWDNSGSVASFSEYISCKFLQR